MTRAAIYARASTEDQVASSIPAQVDECRAHAASLGLDVVAEFKDEGLSAYKDVERPSFEAMRRAAHAGEFDTLVVWNTDRLSRKDGSKGALALKWDLDEHGVSIASVTQPSIEDAFAADIMALVEGHRAHSESRTKSANVKRGMQQRLAKGLPPGRVAYGYVVADGKLVPSDSAAVVRRVFNEYADGRAQQAIARGLEADGVPTPSGGKHWTQAQVRAMLRNPAYVGRLRTSTGEVQGVHDPIVSDDLYDAAQARMTTAGPRQAKGRDSKTHLLSKLLVCSCGETMLARAEDSASRHYAVYLCPRASGRVPGECDVKPIRRDVIDTAVLDHFHAHGVDLDATKAALAARRSEVIADLEAIAGAAVRLASDKVAAVERVKRDYLAGDITAAEWKELRAVLESERDAAQQHADEATARLAAAQAEPVADVEARVAAELEAVRQAVEDGTAGDDIPSQRAHLQRVFSRFRLVPAPHGWPVEWLHEPTDPRGHIMVGSIGHVLWLELRPEVVDGFADETPLVKRVHLSGAFDNSGFADASFWPHPIALGRAA